MSYRTTPTDPDYRRQPKTQCYCVMCQRDLAPGSPIRWIACELDKLPMIIHPADVQQAWAEIRPRRSPHHHNDVIQFERVGPDCARKLGLEWTLPDDPRLRIPPP